MRDSYWVMQVTENCRKSRADDDLKQINVSHIPSDTLNQHTYTHLHFICLLIKLMSLSVSASARPSV